MTTIYVLQHESSTGDVKLIGLYSSQAEAAAAVERARKLPGFVKDPDGFAVDGYSLGQDHWTAGFVSVHDEETDRARSETDASRAA